MPEVQLLTLGNILKDKAELIIGALKKNLEAHDSIASRALFQSIRTEIKVFGNSYTLELFMEDYWKWVDEGRKPGKMPPIDKIAKWIAQKGIPIRSMVKASPLKRKSKLSLSERIKSRNRSLAFLIARKIAKHGTKGTHFYSDVINDKFFQDLNNDIGEALKKDYTIEIIKATHGDNN